jgi:hypothetical protein
VFLKRYTSENKYVYLYDEVLEKAKGYKSYIDSFSNIFDVDEKDKKYPEYIIKSAESNVKSYNIKKEKSKEKYTFSIILIGLFISFNIFLNSFSIPFIDSEYICSIYNYISRDNILLYSFLLLIMSLIYYFNKFGLIRYDNKFFEIFRFLNLAPKLVVFFILPIVWILKIYLT